MKKAMLVLMLLLVAGAAWGQRDEVPALDWFDPATAINQGSLTEAGEVISKKLTVSGLATLDTATVTNGLGVGKDTPTSQLHVANIANAALYPKLTIGNEFTGLWDFGDIISEISFRSEDTSGAGPRQKGLIQMINDQAGDGNSTMSGAMTFWTSPFNDAAIERVRIDSAGNVGINTDTPVGKLHVDQSSDSAAIPTAIFDQADISEGVINFVASDRGSVPTSTVDSVASVRVEINGTVYVLALHADQ